MRRHQQWVTRIGGLMLVLVGVLLVTGAWDWVVHVAPGPPDQRIRAGRMTGTDVKDTGGRDRQATPMPTDLNARELGRWMWRQLTSMRTALVLLLLLALAAIPGSVVPQEDVDSLGTSNWRDAHPTLTPIYERLGLFSVYDSPVVLRDLHPADDLARRLHRAADGGLLAGAAGQAAAGAAEPLAGCPSTRRTRRATPRTRCSHVPPPS